MRAALLTLLILLGGCRDDRPPAPTAAESDQLNEAENLLNAEAVNDQGANNGKGPEDRSSSPSR